MDFKKILNTITSEKGEELLNGLKEKGDGLKEKSGGLKDLLQEKLQEKLAGNKGEQPVDQQAEAQPSGLEAMLQGKLKDLAEKAKNGLESKIKK